MNILVYIPFSMRSYKTHKFKIAEESHMTIILNEASVLPEHDFHIFIPLKEQTQTFPHNIPENVFFIERKYKYIKDERTDPIPLKNEKYEQKIFDDNLSKFDVIYTHECYNFSKLFKGFNLDILYNKTIAVIMYLDDLNIKNLYFESLKMKLLFFRTSYIHAEYITKIRNFDEYSKIIENDNKSIIFDAGINPEMYDIKNKKQENIVIIPTRISDQEHNRTQQAIEFAEQTFRDYRLILLNPNDVEYKRDGWEVGPYSKSMYIDLLSKCKYIVNFSLIKKYASVGVCEQILLSKALLITETSQQFDNQYLSSIIKSPILNQNDFNKAVFFQKLHLMKIFDLRYRSKLLEAYFKIAANNKYEYIEKVKREDI